MDVQLRDTGGSALGFNGFDIDSFRILGADSSSDATGMKIRGVGLLDLSMYPGDALYPWWGNAYSDYATAIAGTSPAVWEADFGVADIGSINACHDSDNCYWEAFYVEIWDPDAATMSDSDCKATYLPSVYWCPEWSPTPAPRTAYASTARRRTSAHSACSPGSGRFQLVPTLVRDLDGDGKYSAELAPVQISGTGAYTGAAWLQSITPVHTLSTPLWVFDSAADEVTFWLDDSVRWPLDRHLVPPAGLTFRGTEVPGAARFAVEEAADNALPNLQVDTSWTCAAPSPDEVIDPTAGYTATLADLGCMGGWAQGLTIRPGALHSASVMGVEPYGQPSLLQTVPLDPVAGGDHFVFDKGGLYIEGVVGTRHPSTGANVTLLHAKLDGGELCDTGPHFFPAEQ